MAENRLNVTLTATNKASKVINDVNKQVNRLFRPLDNAGRQVKSVYDALGRNDVLRRSSWMVTKLGQGFTTLSTTFGAAENSVLGGSARVAAALGSIGGPIGALLAGTAAVAGGAAAVSVRMASMGQNISRTAKDLNLSTTQLQQYRGAAKLAGLQTEAMDNALGNLGSTLYDADAGINQGAAAALTWARIDLKKTKDGLIDVDAAFHDIADRVQQMPNAVEQRKLTDALGVTELLPLLRMGGKALDDLLAKVKRLGILNDEQIEQNEQQANAWNETKTAMDAAGVSMGNLIAKWFDLNTVAASTSALAEKLQKSAGFWDTVKTLGGETWKNIWNYSPQTFFLRKMFGEIGGQSGGATGSWADGAASPDNRRSATGKVTDMTGAPAQSTSPIGIRQNNPGNLRSWPGAGSAGGFAVFPTPEAGIAAMVKNLGSYQDMHGINTIPEIVHRWAPASDNNNERAYTANLVKETGFAADQRLDLHDPKILTSLVGAITKQENGRNPYSPELIASAVARAAGAPAPSATAPQFGLGGLAKTLTRLQDQFQVNTVTGIAGNLEPVPGPGRAPAANPSDLAADLGRQTGFAPDQQLDLHDPKTLTSLVTALAKRADPQQTVDPAAIARAVADAVKEAMASTGDRPVRLEFVNLPQGISVKTGGGLGRPFTGLIMAPGGAP